MVALKEYFPQLTPAEYLAWEEQQEFRYESIDFLEKRRMW
jgi:hypothetical protein